LFITFYTIFWVVPGQFIFTGQSLQANFEHITILRAVMIKLNDDFLLGVENNEKKVRLIVYKGGVENVCRKGNSNKLKQFILSDQNTAFKGRLQLHKSMDGIVVEVKGRIAGIIKADELINYLERTG